MVVLAEIITRSVALAVDVADVSSQRTLLVSSFLCVCYALRSCFGGPRFASSALIRFPLSFGGLALKGAPPLYIKLDSRILGIRLTFHHLRFCHTDRSVITM